MNKLACILMIGFFISCGTSKNTAEISSKSEKQIITKIDFPKDDPSKIILNNKHALTYKRNGNDFEIFSLTGEKLIHGVISYENDRWISVIDFLTVNKKFSNAEIVGRNDLIFSLAESNIITEDFEINNEKLLLYIERLNELN